MTHDNNMTSEEARKRLNEILDRMEADANEINDMHRAVVPRRGVGTGQSRPYRDAKENRESWRAIADIIVRKIEIKENDQTT